MGATYIECSAKESRGVDQVFELAINTAIQVEDNGKSNTGPSGGSSGGLKGGKKVKKRQCRIL